MNIINPIIKSLIFFLAAMSLCSCVHLKSPQENLADLENKTVAAVISGCTLKYKTNNTFLPDTDTSHSCSVNWSSGPNNTISLEGYTSITFLAPGTYKFSGVYADLYDRRYISYHRDEGEPSIFTDFSVQGGEVIYIGDFLIDLRKTKSFLHATKPVEYYSNEYLMKVLSRNYPTIANKIERRLVRTRPEFKYARSLLPILEEEK